MTQFESGWMRHGVIIAALVAMPTVLQSMLVHYGGAQHAAGALLPVHRGGLDRVVRRGAVVATLVSALLSWLLFLGDPLAYPPSPAMQAMQAMQVGMFLLVASVVCAVVAAAFRHACLTNETLRRREAAARQHYEITLASLAQGVMVIDPLGRFSPA